MSQRGTDRSDDRPTAAPGVAPHPRTEPVLALLGAAAAGLARLLTNTGGLWVWLDMGAALAAVSALAMLLRALSVQRHRPALAEFATGTVTAGLSLDVLLAAMHGPEARVGALVFWVAAGMGGVLTVLILGGAGLRYLREDRAGADTATVPGGVGRTAALVTVLAAAAALAGVVADVVRR